MDIPGTLAVMLVCNVITLSDTSIWDGFHRINKILPSFARLALDFQGDRSAER